MDWSINLPVRRREDPVFELGIDAHHLDNEEETAICHKLTLDAISAGHETVGDLLDELEGLSDRERRQRLDQVRSSVGLPSTGEVERDRADLLFERAWQRLQIPGPDRWSELQRCPVCGVYPTEASVAWKRVSVERWHCPEHVDQAAEGDMSEHVAPVIGLGLNGQPIYSAKEKARIREEVRKRDEPQRELRRQREEHARRQAEALDEVRETFEREATVSIAGVRVHPGDVNVK